MDGELLELEHCEGVSLGEDKGMKELGGGGVVSVVESEVKQDRVCERRDKSTKKGDFWEEARLSIGLGIVV